MAQAGYTGWLVAGYTERPMEVGYTEQLMEAGYTGWLMEGAGYREGRSMTRYTNQNLKQGQDRGNQICLRSHPCHHHAHL